MPDVVFYDAETQSTLSDVGDNFDHLQVSCLCAIAVDADMILKFSEQPSEIEYILREHGRQLVLWRDEAELDTTRLKSCSSGLTTPKPSSPTMGSTLTFRSCESTTMATTACKRYLSHRCKTLDPCKTIEAATGIRTKLDQLLKSNGLETKSANGLEAIDWWNAGQAQMKLRSYCMKDVEVMARLVLHTTIQMSGVCTLPNAVFGIASFSRPEMLPNSSRR